MKKSKIPFWNSAELTDLFEQLECSIYLCEQPVENATSQIILRAKEVKDLSRLEIFGVCGKKLSEEEQDEYAVSCVEIHDDNTNDKPTKELLKEVTKILKEKNFKIKISQ